jgi:5-methylcytosine-specific restriction endonuclease McrA
MRGGSGRRLRTSARRCCAATRTAAHAHHVLYRSHGGGDEPENLVALCAAHHLHGVHRGYVRVHGRAPDGLRWELGARGAG